MLLQIFVFALIMLGVERVQAPPMKELNAQIIDRASLWIVGRQYDEAWRSTFMTLQATDSKVYDSDLEKGIVLCQFIRIDPISLSSQMANTGRFIIPQDTSDPLHQKYLLVIQMQKDENALHITVAKTSRYASDILGKRILSRFRQVLKENSRGILIE